MRIDIPDALVGLVSDALEEHASSLAEASQPEGSELELLAARILDQRDTTAHLWVYPEGYVLPFGLRR